jgi:hypothetical protein
MRKYTREEVENNRLKGVNELRIINNNEFLEKLSEILQSNIPSLKPEEITVIDSEIRKIKQVQEIIEKYKIIEIRFSKKELYSEMPREDLIMKISFDRIFCKFFKYKVTVYALVKYVNVMVRFY